MSKNRERISVTLPPDLIEKVRSLPAAGLSNLSTSRKVEYLLGRGLEELEVIVK
jgi:hypothetical protein